MWPALVGHDRGRHQGATPWRPCDARRPGPVWTPSNDSFRWVALMLSPRSAPRKARTSTRALEAPLHRAVPLAVIFACRPAIPIRRRRRFTLVPCPPVSRLRSRQLLLAASLVAALALASGCGSSDSKKTTTSGQIAKPSATQARAANAKVLQTGGVVYG